MRVFVLLLSVLVSLLAFPDGAQASAGSRGKILLLAACPGDQRVKADGKEMPILGALLTPLLSTAVNQGMKAWGAKLTMDAQEANFDVIHHGSHLYRYNALTERFDLAFGCIVVASKGVIASKGGLPKIVEGYLALKSRIDERPVENTWTNGEVSLRDVLEAAGIETDRPPGVVGVFDIQMSEQRREARLVPRFIAMHHSVREKKSDAKSRTITFELLLEQPGAANPFGNPIYKIDDLVSGRSFVQKFKPSVDPVDSSEWFALPALPAAIVSRMEATVEFKSGMTTSREAARLSLQAAIALGESSLSPYQGDIGPCPTANDAKRGWVSGRTLLALEQAKPKDEQKLLPRLEAVDRFYTSCVGYYGFEQRLSETSLQDRTRAGAFDATATLKEFRERPFAKFFGAVLSSDTVAGGVASVVSARIDPVKADAEEKAIATLREAFETAMVTAENAILAYEAATESEKAAKYIDREAKKRSANRKARELSQLIPYPDSGFWF